MSFFKKLKSKKSFSVFSTSSSSNSPSKKQTLFNNNNNNTNLGLSPVKSIQINGNKLLESGGNNSSYVIGDEFGIASKAMSNHSQNTSFFSHTKSFISHKLKSNNNNNNKSKMNSSINDSFNSATNSNSSPANQSLATSRTPPSPSTHNQTVSSRTLIVYHIDSETEGSFNLNVKVSVSLEII